MGQQQLLLIVLGIIVVGVAVAFAIAMFRQGAIDSKRDLVMNENANLANMAIQYYRKPQMLGGGGNTFLGWAIPSELIITASGNYWAEVYQDSVVIIGTGNDVVNGTDSVRVRTTVTANTHFSLIVH